MKTFNKRFLVILLTALLILNICFLSVPCTTRAATVPGYDNVAVAVEDLTDQAVDSPASGTTSIKTVRGFVSTGENISFAILAALACLGMALMLGSLVFYRKKVEKEEENDIF